MDRTEEVNQIMNSIPESWRYRWCTSSLCACLGCANVSGRANITKEEHAEWVSRNPESERDKHNWRSFSPTRVKDFNEDKTKC